MKGTAALKQLRPWLVFGGGVLVIGILAQLRELLVPIAIAVLFAFLLAPVTALLQRRVGRLPAVLTVVVGGTAALGAITFFAWQELATLANHLPDYRDNIRAKVADVRGMTEGGVLQSIEELVADIEKQFEKRKSRRAPEVVVSQPGETSTFTVSMVVGSIVELLVDAGIVFVLVTFMLLERQQLRDRLLRFFGHRQLAITTKAVDEAGRRMSRYLFAQLLLNTFYGVVVGVALYLLDIPHALLWGFLATALRFIPYVGPWLAAIPPILLSLAVAPGWVQPLAVAGVFIVLELLTNLVLETHFYAGVAGISQVGLLIAILFWSWVWGAAGLLLAAPLTVCLVVIGKHVRALNFLSELMTAEAPPDTRGRYYQRLLAGDQVEAAEILQEHLQQDASENVYDALMIPALAFAERDVTAGALDPQEETSLQQATSQLLDEILEAKSIAGDAPVTDDKTDDKTLMLAFPISEGGDVLALRMLADLMTDTAVQLEIESGSYLYAEIVQLIQTRGSQVVYIMDLPPSSSAKTRYLLRRLRAVLPQLHIVVGRCAPTFPADDDVDEIMAAGANQVCTTLAQSRQQLCQLRGLQPSSPQEAAFATHPLRDVRR